MTAPVVEELLASCALDVDALLKADADALQALLAGLERDRAEEPSRLVALLRDEEEALAALLRDVNGSGAG